MKKLRILILYFVLFLANHLVAQRGYFDAPYMRYEADSATLLNASITAKSYTQSDLQSEASNQVCVDLSASAASVEWTVSAAGDGLVLRYSVPDGDSGVVEIYVDNILTDTLKLTSYYSWENLGLANTNPKMRFDEVRLKLSSPVFVGKKLKLVRKSGDIHIDFIELEAIPTGVPSTLNDLVYSGDGSTLQSFIDAHGGKTIYIPAGIYEVGSELYFGVSNTVLKGAGMWHTRIHFTDAKKGGLRANANNISYSDLYLSTVRNSRSNSYKAINGVYTSGSTIVNVWAEHFECGAWIGQYNTGGPAYADAFTLSNCRFRNNYADGINLCKGTRNAVVEHCSFRNNGDDDMAIWSANGLECQNNTFRYNTSEHCWRSAGCAIYGGLNNQAHHLLIKDNLEVGLKVNNDFTGMGFNKNGMQVFSDITIIACGTFNDLFNGTVGAIDVACNNIAGTRINNVKFSNIDIVDSKNNAIYIYKKGGEGFYNLIFENININGTGKEFPNNNVKNLNWGRGYGILFVGNPTGYGTYCNITYSDRGGNAASNVNDAQIGTFSWTADCSPPSTTIITSASTFGICDAAVTIEATTVAPALTNVSYLEFFVDDVSIGRDSTSEYSVEWSNPTGGNHQFKTVAHYSDLSESLSSTQYIIVEEGIFTTATAPVIDGVIDEIWNSYQPFSLDKISVGSFSGPADLSVNFKVTRDATNLYFLVDVTDDILRNDGAATWQKDVVEIFIDMGNDKAGSYVANNDFQYTFVYNVATAKTGLTFMQTTKDGNVGYVLEIMIPWATLGGVPVEGTFMGIDVQVDDNDTGTRNGKKAWNDDSDNAWQSTSVLGTLQIAACANPYHYNAVLDFINKKSSFSFYPNPFSVSGNLNLNSKDGELFSISILDINGKILSNTNLVGSGIYSVGEDLAPGMYLLKVSDGFSTETAKFIKY
jgi:hypothetical protein